MAATTAVSHHIGLNDSTDHDSDGPKLSSFTKGDIVDVTRRTWAGINKPGGVGRITLIDNENQTANVKYSLGGTEKNITFDYLTPWNVNLSMQKSVGDAIVEGEAKRTGRGRLKDQKYEIDQVQEKHKKPRKKREIQTSEDTPLEPWTIFKGNTRKRQDDENVAINLNETVDAVARESNLRSSIKSFAGKKKIALSQNNTVHQQKKRKIDQGMAKQPRKESIAPFLSGSFRKLECVANKTTEPARGVEEHKKKKTSRKPSQAIKMHEQSIKGKQSKKEKSSHKPSQTSKMHEQASKGKENKKETSSHKSLVNKLKPSKPKENSNRAAQLAQPKSQFPALWQRAKDFTSNVLGVSSSCDTSLVSSNASSPKQKANIKVTHALLLNPVPKTLKTSLKGQDVSPLRNKERGRPTEGSKPSSTLKLESGPECKAPDAKSNGPELEDNKHYTNFVRHMQRIMDYDDGEAKLTEVLQSMQKDSCPCPEADAHFILAGLDRVNRVMLDQGVIYRI